MELVKELSGHSGCHLNLYKENGDFFLRKDAGSVDYNQRLKRQCAKQRCFRLEQVKTPSVLKYGYDEKGVFYFDMEFVNGITMAEYMNRIKIKEIVDLMGLLFKSLQIKRGRTDAKTKHLFKEKIASLSFLKNTNVSVRKEAFDVLDDFDFEKVPISPCCGDLTLENIILSSSGIYVIDLLDSFCNSWMIDVAKLLQDIDLGWSYRHQECDYTLNLRLATAKQALIDNLLAMENGEENLITIYHVLLLNILRIYPYTKDEKTFQFLDNATKKVLTTIKTMENRK